MILYNKKSGSYEPLFLLPLILINQELEPDRKQYPITSGN